ncbi:MarR family transcriptional regulator [Ramlibacter rhizophilus]|uniref:MarR family transcriptional regulator n=2 Tax=Ramlibacter rhizophilus TaxID=1781167 RepID=A0A4Z0BI33_9BURK|nr:MarR family transcriptional regulator [Ramlibacter rhizophilus]
MVARTASALRRTITLPYAERFGLTVSEWRMLSVLAEAGEMSFSELVVQSVADKAQVSRTLKLMQERGLVALEGSEGNPRWKQLRCRITAKGKALYEEVMPFAQRSQAAMLLTLSREERIAMYRALKRLREVCERSGPIDGSE